MTREEAIEKLVYARQMADDDIQKEWCESLDMAINALEQESYEKFESAKDHIYKLAGDYKCWDNRLTQDEAVELCHILEQEPCDKYINEIDHLRKYISKLETQIVEQEPKTGHWRPVYQGDEIIDYRCSECEFGNTFGKGTYGMNYCPNCGARMVEPQESEGV